MNSVHGSSGGRWQDYRPSKTQTFWIAAGAVVATLVIGFGPGGWTTASGARALADQAASQARQTLAAAVCVSEAKRTSDLDAKLAALKQAAWHERNDLVIKEGWARMPDEQEPSWAVARLCAEQIATLETPAADSVARDGSAGS
jgi:hypothetical protein